MKHVIIGSVLVALDFPAALLRPKRSAGPSAAKKAIASRRFIWRIQPAGTYLFVYYCAGGRHSTLRLSSKYEFPPGSCNFANRSCNWRASSVSHSVQPDGRPCADKHGIGGSCGSQSLDRERAPK